MSNDIYLRLFEEGFATAKEFADYVNNLQTKIDELRDVSLEEFERVAYSLDSELDMCIHLYNDGDLTAEERKELLDKMDKINEKIIIESIKKREYLEAEEEKIRKEREKAVQLTVEFLTGIIPFTTFARAIFKIKNENK